MKKLRWFGGEFLGFLFGCILLTSCTTGPQVRLDAPAGATVEKGWKGLIDSFVLVRDFNVAEYGKIVVEPLDTTTTPLPPKDKNTYEPTYLVLKTSSSIFVMGMKQAFLEAKHPVEPVLSEGAAQKDGKVLIVRGTVTQMEPGSKALRYWVSFGAGQSRVEVSGEVVDAESNTVFAKFVHARSSGIGVLGGDYQKFLTDDTRDVGEDVGKMLLLFDKSRANP
jgi:hypothetical protein